MTEKELAIRVGKKIGKVRGKQKVTSEQLAYENDISKGYLSDIENGKRLPSLKMLLKIANALNSNIRDLL